MDRSIVASLFIHWFNIQNPNQADIWLALFMAGNSFIITLILIIGALKIYWFVNRPKAIVIVITSIIIFGALLWMLF